MIPWKTRPAEEKTLLSPSFCSVLLWQAAGGYSSIANTRLPFDLAFLVLPIVLHRNTRTSLPKAVTTSLAVWLDDNPLMRARIADRARTLVPFTKEALLFGGLHGLLDLANASVGEAPDWKKRIGAEIKASSDEVQECASRAYFLGRWLAKGGSPSTVMATLGVRP